MELGKCATWVAGPQDRAPPLSMLIKALYKRARVCERSSEGYADEDPVLTIFTVTFTVEGNRDFISLQVALIQLTSLALCSSTVSHWILLKNHTIAYSAEHRNFARSSSRCAKSSVGNLYEVCLIYVVLWFFFFFHLRTQLRRRRRKVEEFVVSCFTNLNLEIPYRQM